MILIADSGSTKTDWVLLSNGAIVKAVRTQGINPIHQTPSIVQQTVKEELLPYLDAESVSSLFFYGAGCTPTKSEEMCHTLKSFFASATIIEAESDLLGAARALCGREKGIACILGTGSNSGLYDGKNIVRNIPPLGYILGDEGSGAALGRAFLNALYKEELPKSVLTKFHTEFHLDYNQVIEQVYRKPLANRFLASLSPFICQHKDEWPQLKRIVIDNFRLFLRKNVQKYESSSPINAVGSVAFYFCDLLKEAITEEHLLPGKILQKPIQGLIEYHSNQKNL